MSSFYAQRCQKHKKYSQGFRLFALLGSGCVKAARKTLVKSTPVVEDLGKRKN